MFVLCWLSFAAHASAQWLPTASYYVGPTATTYVVPYTPPPVYCYPPCPEVQYVAPTYVAPVAVLPTYVTVEHDVWVPSNSQSGGYAPTPSLPPSTYAAPALRTLPRSPPTNRSRQLPLRSNVDGIGNDFVSRTRNLERSKAELFRVLDASLQTAKKGSITDDVTSTVLLMRITEAVVQDAPHVERAHREYIEQAAQYVADLQAMAPRLRAAGDELESFARQEPNGDIKEGYLQSARLIRAWEQRVDDTVNDTQLAIRAVRDNYEYTVSMGTMLKRLLSAMQTIERLPSPVDTDVLKTPLTEYVQHTEKLKNSIPQLTDQLVTVQSPATTFRASR